MLRLARFVPSLILAAASLACAPSVPAVVSVEPPPGADAPEMAKHLYAAYWMGHGLLATNDEAWTRGAEALADAPLAAPGGVGAEDEARVHALAKQALPITEPTERAKAFGQLLSSCSPCHVALLNDP